ncbi:MAG: site-2 protease family protein [Candidatus Falkowbacteria bacterium]|nr:site-2 protease family protein [Candidatus Falkowbacteria bacterium]
MLIQFLTIAILMISAIFHEYAHGWMAFKLGDNTAKNEGRLTLNPIAHIDIFGTILLPLLLIISKAGFMIAWAKPVPYNPNNLNNQKYGDMLVAVAGPATNFVLAIFFGLIARLNPIPLASKYLLVNSMSNGDALLSAMNGSILASIFVMSIIFCMINLALMIFNLIPVPPLDGSKILATFLPYRLQMEMHKLEPYGIFIIILLLSINFFNFIWPIISFLFATLIGLNYA